MNNIYFIETDSYELLEIKVGEILKKNKLTITNLISYDMEETNISDAIIDLDTYSLFNERKVVLCKNCIFLGTGKSYSLLSRNYFPTCLPYHNYNWHDR